MVKYDLYEAFQKIEELDKRIIVLEHESRLQFKELFVRLKRIEGLLIGACSAIIILLTTMMWKI